MKRNKIRGRRDRTVSTATAALGLACRAVWCECYSECVTRVCYSSVLLECVARCVLLGVCCSSVLLGVV